MGETCEKDQKVNTCIEKAELGLGRLALKLTFTIEYNWSNSK